uniref:Hexosyltransferase n=3 Tax=Rhodnius TaxID=13248 RepID=A0A0P4VUJ4_9HEMI
MVSGRKLSKLLCNRKFSIIIVLFLLYFFGIFTLFFEKSYSLYYANHFDKQIAVFVNQWLKNEVPQITGYNNYNYKFIYKCEKKCKVDDDGPLRLVYIVKSATRNFDKREGIRNSWGFEKRFSDVEIRTVFMLGIDQDDGIQKRIREESKAKGDIVQVDFQDTYYNNTIKTLMAMKWVLDHCNKAKFYFFSDDDMYVSTKNVLRFVRNPIEYPGYLEVPVKSVQLSDQEENPAYLHGKEIKTIVDIELRDDNELYAGYVFRNSRPMRYLFSKWYVPVDEYPYDLWPPYVTAGAYVLSNRALKKLYYASMYVRHFRFDDIYLSMLAKSVNIVPLHSAEFYFYKKSYDPYGYRYVIASHGYDNPEELRWVWNDQKSNGNA